MGFGGREPAWALKHPWASSPHCTPTAPPPGGGRFAIVQGVFGSSADTPQPIADVEAHEKDDDAAKVNTAILTPAIVMLVILLFVVVVAFLKTYQKKVSRTKVLHLPLLS